MSRFWAAGESSSESDSDDSDDSSSSDDDSFTGVKDRGGDKQWVMSDESDSEDEVRVVISAKDRFFDALKKKNSGYPQ